MASPTDSITLALNKWMLDVVTGKTQTTQANKDSINRGLGIPQAPPDTPQADTPPVALAILQAARRASYAAQGQEVNRRQGGGQGGGSAAMVSGRAGGITSSNTGVLASGAPGSLASLGATLLGV